jgi:hypothetical protein
MTTLRRLPALAAAFALTLALAGPAAAFSPSSVGRAGVPAWACSPADIAAGVGSTARGEIRDSSGQIREMNTGQIATDLPASAKGKAPADFAVTVPVYFHVITDGSLGYLSNKDIRAQIRVLDVTFGGGEGGANTGFDFELAGITRTDNARWFEMGSTGAEHEMKQALKQGGDNALNVYSNTAAAYLGWAYLPSITDTNQSYLDGIVLDWETLPGVSERYEGRYDLGETLTHEAGHWLNLEHTFYNGCRGDGDFVADTPAMKVPTSGCPEGKDTCPAPGSDPIHNYMDYSYDSCYTEYTDGQTQRMRDAWLFYRAP